MIEKSIRNSFLCVAERDTGLYWGDQETPVEAGKVQR